MPNVVEIGARRAPSNQPLAVDALADAVCERLTGAFRATLSGCDDILFGHAQRAMNGLRQAQYFDDLRQLRLSNQAAVRAFATTCRSAMRTGVVETATMPRRADDPLQLVADEDLELDLALFRIGKRCDEVAPRLRHQVQRRLELLYGLGDGAATPLGGAAIAKICRAGIAPLDIGLDSRLIVLKQVERQLSAAMEGVLEAANAVLLAHGLLPNLKPTAAPTVRPAAPTATVVARTGAVGSPVPAPMPASNVDVQQLGEALQRMTQWMQSSAAVAPIAATHATPASTPASVAVDERELERERRREEIANRRAAERERARELRIAAERSADVVVSRVMNQAHVPECIGQAIGGPLRRHLEAVHARRGETSTEWRSACKLVRDIAWALDPETATSERGHWRAMVPDIVTSLRTTLIASGADDATVDRIVAEFGTRYEAMLAEHEPTEVEQASTGSSNTAEREDAPVSIAQRATPSFGDALRQIRQLTLGRWFELVDDQGRAQRAKLVWTSAMTERCLFVNAQGKLVADRPHARMADELLAGQFREVDEAATAPA